MPFRNVAVDGTACHTIDCAGTQSHIIRSREIMSLKSVRLAILFLLTILLFSTAAAASSYQYFRIGEKADSTATPVAGTALMGGGKDLDEAFRWLC